MIPARREWDAIGTRVVVLCTDATRVAAAAEAVAHVIDRADRAYSRFRRDSELSRVNESSGRTVTVGPLLALALDAALDAARRSGGAVDPTVGAAVRRIGYDRDFTLLREEGPLLLTVTPVPGWTEVRLDRAARRLWTPPGCRLDLGSVGKALAVDLGAASAATAANGAGVLVSIGGDIAVGGEAPVEGWRVLVAEDCRTPPDGEGQTVCVRSPLATSSTTVRRWRRGGVDLHHLIDPSTGLPADGPWRTATVAAASCVDANTAATAAIVLGEGAIPWLESEGLPARLVSTVGRVAAVNGWPAGAQPQAVAS
ncbi:MAG TPA: FAD:protein FMN transferase [Candidatus Dormibacteraeota bacterium]|jgi:thiamine biosynthesis lipoprotein|nr:FAD:protein FMN transferase [Candidatus Dormibacteraeota bacterium]